MPNQSWEGYVDPFGILSVLTDSARDCVNRALAKLAQGRNRAVRYHTLNCNGYQIASITHDYGSGGRILVTTQRVRGISCLVLLEVIENHQYESSLIAPSRGADLNQVMQRFSELRKSGGLHTHLFAGMGSAAAAAAAADEEGQVQVQDFAHVIRYNNRVMELDLCQVKSLGFTDVVVEGAMGTGKSITLYAAMQSRVGSYTQPRKPSKRPQLLFVTENPMLVNTTAQQFFENNGHLFSERKIERDDKDGYSATLVSSKVHLCFRSVSTLFSEGISLVGLGEFSRWIRKQVKHTTLEGIGISRLYCELKLFYHLGEQAYQELGRKQSRFRTEEEKQDLSVLAKSYLSHMQASNQKDPQLNPEMNLGYDAIFVDEFEQNSVLLNSLLAKRCQGVYYYGDINQSNDLLAHIQLALLKESLERESGRNLSHYRLSRNYRNSRSVVQLINNVLRILNAVCQRRDSYLQIPYQSAREEIGSCGLLSSLPESKSHDIFSLNEAVVLVRDDISDSEIRKIAESYFHKYPVIRVSHFQGMEAHTVILHHILSEKAAVLAPLDADLPGLSAKLKENSAKDTRAFLDNEEYTAEISRLLVAVSRGVTQVLVVQSFAHLVNLKAYFTDACKPQAVLTEGTPQSPEERRRFIEPIIRLLIETGDIKQAESLYLSYQLGSNFHDYLMRVQVQKEEESTQLVSGGGVKSSEPEQSQGGGESVPSIKWADKIYSDILVLHPELKSKQGRQVKKFIMKIEALLGERVRYGVYHNPGLWYALSQDKDSGVNELIQSWIKELDKLLTERGSQFADWKPMGFFYHLADNEFRNSLLLKWFEQDRKSFFNTLEAASDHDRLKLIIEVSSQRQHLKWLGIWVKEYTASFSSAVLSIGPSEESDVANMLFYRAKIIEFLCSSQEGLLVFITWSRVDNEIFMENIPQLLLEPLQVDLKEVTELPAKVAQFEPSYCLLVRLIENPIGLKFLTDWLHGEQAEVLTAALSDKRLLKPHPIADSNQPISFLFILSMLNSGNKFLAEWCCVDAPSLANCLTADALSTVVISNNSASPMSNLMMKDLGRGVLLNLYRTNKAPYIPELLSNTFSGLFTPRIHGAMDTSQIYYATCATSESSLELLGLWLKNNPEQFGKYFTPDIVLREFDDPAQLKGISLFFIWIFGSNQLALLLHWLCHNLPVFIEIMERGLFQRVSGANETHGGSTPFELLIKSDNKFLLLADWFSWDFSSFSRIVGGTLNFGSKIELSPAISYILAREHGAELLVDWVKADPDNFKASLLQGGVLFPKRFSAKADPMMCIVGMTNGVAFLNGWIHKEVDSFSSVMSTEYLGQMYRDGDGKQTIVTNLYMFLTHLSLFYTWLESDPESFANTLTPDILISESFETSPILILLKAENIFLLDEWLSKHPDSLCALFTHPDFYNVLHNLKGDAQVSPFGELLSSDEGIGLLNRLAQHDFNLCLKILTPVALLDAKVRNPSGYPGSGNALFALASSEAGSLILKNWCEREDFIGLMNHCGSNGSDPGVVYMLCATHGLTILTYYLQDPQLLPKFSELMAQINLAQECVNPTAFADCPIINLMLMHNNNLFHLAEWVRLDPVGFSESFTPCVLMQRAQPAVHLDGLHNQTALEMILEHIQGAVILNNWLTYAKDNFISQLIPMLFERVPDPDSPVYKQVYLFCLFSQSKADDFSMLLINWLRSDKESFAKMMTVDVLGHRIGINEHFKCSNFIAYFLRDKEYHCLLLEWLTIDKASFTRAVVPEMFKEVDLTDTDLEESFWHLNSSGEGKQVLKALSDSPALSQLSFMNRSKSGGAKIDLGPSQQKSP